MTAREFIFTPENGRPPRDVEHDLVALFRRMEGKRVTVAVKEWKRPRSNKQNRFLWGVVYPVVVEMFVDCGTMTDEEQVHEQLKERFGIKESVLGPDGMRITAPKSTTRYTTQEMSNYVESIRAWAARFEYDVPLPNEQLESRPITRNVLREGVYAEGG